MQSVQAWGPAGEPASLTTDRILVARLEVGTTALALWQGNAFVVLVSDSIPKTSRAAVAAHARSHIGDVESEGAETSVACTAPACVIAQTWTPVGVPAVASGL